MQELQKALKLRSLIVDNFIPPHKVERLTSKTYYDEDMDEWKLRPQEPPSKNLELVVPRHVSAIGCLRPTYVFARMASQSGDPRYMAENIFKIELDMPNRTTQDNEGPLVAPHLQAALDAALQDNKELTFDVSAFTNGGGSSRPKAVRRTKTRMRQEQRSEGGSEQFPSSRGLVLIQNFYYTGCFHSSSCLCT